MRKTAMQNLKEDLLEAIVTGKEALNEIQDVNIKSACKTILETTIKNIINRIDNELLEMEKEQIEKAVVFGNRQDFYDVSEEIGGNYYNLTYTQSSE